MGLNSIFLISKKFICKKRNF